ncbi:MAG: haloacid dehalogenase-like hydrolase [Gemmatimonadales bacterium]|jgi:phosphoglycolate phosphatase-like HAD superfamily hydrolase|nr:MAG: haloacid dehalogenase-like hydrolase [Gemmatimonadales bacterium]
MRRLLLFDIDGTLVAGGPAKDAFHIALLDAFGTAGPIEVHDFAGKTDPQIARELLRRAGVGREEIDRGLPALFHRYLEELEARLPERPMTILPGVLTLMTALRKVEDVGLGLVTGNIAGGAELKLESAGLYEHFQTGAFGSDSEERNDLPGLAVRRASEAWGVDFRPHDVVVIGDTPRDVECGLHHGTLTVGVATGRFARRELEVAGAHFVVDDFSRTEELHDILVG